MASVPIKSRPLKALAFYPEGKNMLKKRFLFVALALAVWTAAAPAVIHARTLRAERVSQWKAAVSVVHFWWGVFLGGTAERGTAGDAKNGCGIDPNGTPLCDPNPGPGMGGSGLQGGTGEDSGDSEN